MKGPISNRFLFSIQYFPCIFKGLSCAYLKYIRNSKLFLMLNVLLIGSTTNSCIMFNAQAGENWKKCESKKYGTAYTHTHTHTSDYAKWNLTFNKRRKDFIVFLVLKVHKSHFLALSHLQWMNEWTNIEIVVGLIWFVF